MNTQQVKKNLECLLVMVNGTREHLGKNFTKRTRISFWYKLSMVIVSAGITLVLGLRIEHYSNIIALILSSILTILTTMDQLQKFTTKDVTIAKRQNEYIKLSLDLTFYLAGNNNPSEEKFLEFKDRYILILDNIVNEISTYESNIKEQIQSISGKK